MDAINAMISIWWDIETCPLPPHLNPGFITSKIVSALHSLGLHLPVDTFCAYADSNCLSTQTQHAFLGAGIRLHHIPEGRKDTKAMTILVDMLIWALEHCPPAHLLLVTSNSEFANALHRLRMRRYNIILACPHNSLIALTSAASTTLVWPDFLSPAELIEKRECVATSIVSERVNTPPKGNGNARRTRSTRSKSVANMEDLERWLGDFLKKMQVQSFDISSLPARFETETSKKLDYQRLGFTKLRDLLLNLCHSAALKQEGARTYILQPKDEGTVKPCKTQANLCVVKAVASREDFERWLARFLNTDIAKKGPNLSVLPTLFERETGKQFNLQHFGFSKLKPFLAQFENLAVLKCQKAGPTCIYPLPRISSQEKNSITSPKKAKQSETSSLNSTESETSSLNSTAGCGGQSMHWVKAGETEASLCVAKSVASRADFEGWLARFLNTDVARQGPNLSRLSTLFEKETGKTLNLQQLGFSKLKPFLAEFKHLAVLECNKAGTMRIFPLRSTSSEDENSITTREEIETRSLILPESIERRRERCGGGENVEQEVKDVCAGRSQASIGDEIKGEACVFPVEKIVAQTGGTLGNSASNQSAVKNSSAEIPFGQSHCGTNTIDDFEKWLAVLIKREAFTNGCPVSLLPSLFRLECGKKLHVRSLGFNTLKNLLDQFTHMVSVESPHGGQAYVFPTRHRLSSSPEIEKSIASKEDFERWVSPFLERERGAATQGCLISLLPAMFWVETGKVLDLPHMGFKNLRTFLSQFSHLIVVECPEMGAGACTFRAVERVSPQQANDQITTTTTSCPEPRPQQGLSCSEFVCTDKLRAGDDLIDMKDLQPVIPEVDAAETKALLPDQITTPTPCPEPSPQHGLFCSKFVCADKLRAGDDLIDMKDLQPVIPEVEVAETKALLPDQLHPDRSCEQRRNLQNVYDDTILCAATNSLSNIDQTVGEMIALNATNKLSTQLPAVQANFQLAVSWCRASLHYIAVAVAALIVRWILNEKMGKKYFNN